MTKNQSMNPYLNSEFQDLAAVAEQFKAQYTSAQPFPSISFKNFFNPDFLSSVLEEFPDLSKAAASQYNDTKQIKFEGKGERPFGINTKQLMHFLNSEPFLEFLQSLTSIKETLLGDPYFVGGGMHEIKPGGLLKVHADFNKHPKTNLDRRINVLVYLNKDWQESYGGHFELWDKDMKACVHKILPEFNTLAMFSTTDFSYHGHPNPLSCPPDRSRKSLALYYYSNGRPAEEINPELTKHSTLWKAREGDQADAVALKLNSKQKIKKLVEGITPPVIYKALNKKK